MSSIYVIEYSYDIVVKIIHRIILIKEKKKGLIDINESFVNLKEKLFLTALMNYPLPRCLYTIIYTLFILNYFRAN